MPVSNEVKVLHQGVSVGNDSVLERVHVCFCLGTGGYEVELVAVDPERPEVGLVLEALVLVHEAQA